MKKNGHTNSTVRLGLISDTHIDRQEERLPAEIRSIFHYVDFILHLGDIYLLSVLDELETIAPVAAVRGNGDIRLPHDPRLVENLVVCLYGVRIGLTHGVDFPEPPWRTIEEAMEYEFNGKVDLFIFGDSHVDVLEIYKNTFMINPGSPTFPRQIKEPGTVGILEVDPQGRTSAQIISIATGSTLKELTYLPSKSK